MRYDPKNASSTIAEGEYDASIKHVQTDDEHGNTLTSKAGNEMEKVTFTIYTENGERQLSTYFVNSNKALWRYRKLAEALGQGEEFKSGRFEASNFVGENIRVSIKIKPADGTYDEQNEIAAFDPPASKTQSQSQAGRLAPTNASKTTTPVNPGEINEDDIPF
ncbi:MAG: hypothetical protein ACK5X3_17985 [Pseudomonadota bacterium]|jgi:hypothetical protein